MELRTYLDILRRRRLMIVLVTVLVGAIAFLTSSMEPKVYSAEARVLLRTGDAAEQIDQTALFPLSGTDADRYLAAQLDVVRSEIIAERAAKLVRNSRPRELLRQIRAKQQGTTDIIAISASDQDPQRAAAIANAFATTYIESRRLNAVAGLERASAEIGSKLDELTGRIAQLDADIEREKLAAERAGARQRPGQLQEEDLTTPVMQTLTAARSAAALQYQSLYAQQQTLLVNKSLKKGEAELIAEANAPSAPASPRPKRSTAFGLAFGLVFGLGLALLREQLDDRVRTREQAEEISRLPVLAELPYDGESAKDPARVTAQEHPFGPLAEAARGLRTSLTFLGVDQPLRRIVVTSAGPGEGKSFVTANLAAVYAQSGLRTVIVSADLRRPRIDSIFREAANQGPGLTGVIATFATAKKANSTEGNGNGRGTSLAVVNTSFRQELASAVRATRVENLFLLPAGKLPPNPAELLNSSWCHEVLDELAGVADILIIDAPPVLVVTDAALLATKSDGVMVVAAANETHRGALARASAVLTNSHARLLGVVLNKVDKATSGNYYYYGTYGEDPAKPGRSRLPWRRSKAQGDGEAASKLPTGAGIGLQ